MNVRVKRFNSAYLVSRDKAKEIVHEARFVGATGIIFDDDLTPGQQHNYEELSGMKILDRTELILDIFVQRAKTREGKYQAELAQLNYLLPRLTGRGVMLSRLGAGIGTRGPGETKLEVDRRKIRKKIHTLKEKISKVKKQRTTQRKKRLESHIPTVAIIGYTNAGKSTLLNAVVDSEVPVADQLFVTLNPTSRKARLPDGGEVIFSDTVGFVSKLPHTLVAAFRATLEETTFSDILLILIDASSRYYEHQLEATYEILKELQIQDKPSLIAWNKIDLVEEKDDVEFLLRYKTPSVAISAKSGEGIEKMIFEIQKIISSRTSFVRFRFPYDRYDSLANLHARAKVTKRVFKDDYIYIEAHVEANSIDDFREFISEK